ncbi:MAG: Uncharacterised protein [SAR116 cluster bacterium]|nr:MAG: Uncharacterised protein [SAR116 cluster bacterium]
MWLDGGFEAGGIAGIKKACFKSKAWQILRQHPQRPAIELVPCQHLIALFQQPEEHRRNGAHARTCDNAAGRITIAGNTFQRINLGRENVCIRVAFTRIGIAIHLAFILRIKCISRWRGVDN